MREVIPKALLKILFAAVVFLTITSSYAQWGDKIRIGDTEYRVMPDNEVREMGIELPVVQFFRNSAIDYINAINAYVELPEEPADISSQFYYAQGKWLPEFKELEEWLKSNQPMFDELDKAVEKEYFVLPILGEAKDIVALALPPLQHFRQIARVLAIRAKYFISKGQFSEAIKSYQDILIFSEHINQQPILISGLASIAIHAIGAGGLTDMVLRQDMGLAQLNETLDMLQSVLEKQLKLSKAMQTEKLVTMRFVKMVFDAPDEALGVFDDVDHVMKAMMRIGKHTPVPRLIAETNLREFWQEISRVLEMPLPEFARFFRGYDEKGDWPGEVKLWGPAKLFMPIFYRVRFQYARSELKINALILKTGLQIYKKQHGQYPERLVDMEAILDPFPLDIYTGGDFIYKRTGDGYLFYSLGEDQKDDGGVGDERRFWDGPDFIFTNKVRPYKEYSPTRPGTRS